MCPYQAVEGDLVVVSAKGLFSSASGEFPYHRPIWKPEVKPQVPSGAVTLSIQLFQASLSTFAISPTPR